MSSVKLEPCPDTIRNFQPRDSANGLWVSTESGEHSTNAARFRYAEEPH